MKKSGVKIGLLIKTSGISSFFVLVAILVLAFFNVSSVEKSSLKTALSMTDKKVAGDIVSLEYMVENEYGNIRMVDGILVDSTGQSIHERYDIIDRISSDLGIVATIFVKEGSEYRRISTSIIDDSGNRVINTNLATDGAAYRAIQSGQEYFGSATILGNAYETAYKPIFEPGTTKVIGILFLGISMDTINQLIRKDVENEMVRITIIAVIILFLSILLNAISTNFMLLRPIRSAVHMLKEISQGEGDLTMKLNAASNDEIGDMANYFNLTLEKIKKLVISIKEDAGILSDTGADLASQMTETTAAINEITTHIQDIKNKVVNQSASVTETNATMEQITENIDKLNTHIESQTESVSQSSSAIEEMLANIQSVTNTLVKNAANVNELIASSQTGHESLQVVAQDIQEIAKESEGLLEINSVMENISSQTNLLSMNAAIEAAHAGEAGKGFAVVAGEIRKLAESSSAQSKTISDVLKRMKSSIDKITASTNKVLTGFESINTNVKTVADQEENIRNAMEEQNQGSKQVLNAISKVNEVTGHVKSGSQEMLRGSKEVIKEGKNLDIVTVEISGGINEINTGADQINNAVRNVNELSNKNKESIKRLVEEVSRFKVE
jgi:methyl-accepting chemotaxis protein